MKDSEIEVKAILDQNKLVVENEAAIEDGDIGDNFPLYTLCIPPCLMTVGIITILIGAKTVGIATLATGSVGLVASVAAKFGLFSCNSCNRDREEVYEAVDESSSLRDNSVNP